MTLKNHEECLQRDWLAVVGPDADIQERNRAVMKADAGFDF